MFGQFFVFRFAYYAHLGNIVIQEGGCGMLPERGGVFDRRSQFGFNSRLNFYFGLFDIFGDIIKNAIRVGRLSYDNVQRWCCDETRSDA